MPTRLRHLFLLFVLLLCGRLAQANPAKTAYNGTSWQVLLPSHAGETWRPLPQFRGAEPVVAQTALVGPVTYLLVSQTRQQTFEAHLYAMRQNALAPLMKRRWTIAIPEVGVTHTVSLDERGVTHWQNHPAIASCGTLEGKKLFAENWTFSTQAWSSQSDSQKPKTMTSVAAKPPAIFTRGPLALDVAWPDTAAKSGDASLVTAIAPDGQNGSYLWRLTNQPQQSLVVRNLSPNEPFVAIGIKFSGQSEVVASARFSENRSLAWQAVSGTWNWVKLEQPISSPCVALQLEKPQSGMAEVVFLTALETSGPQGIVRWLSQRAFLQPDAKTRAERQTQSRAFAEALQLALTNSTLPKQKVFFAELALSADILPQVVLQQIADNPMLSKDILAKASRHRQLLEFAEQMLLNDQALEAHKIAAVAILSGRNDQVAYTTLTGALQKSGTASLKQAIVNQLASGSGFRRDWVSAWTPQNDQEWFIKSNVITRWCIKDVTWAQTAWDMLDALANSRSLLRWVGAGRAAIACSTPLEVAKLKGLVQTSPPRLRPFEALAWLREMTRAFVQVLPHNPQAGVILAELRSHNDPEVRALAWAGSDIPPELWGQTLANEIWPMVRKAQFANFVRSCEHQPQVVSYLIEAAAKESNHDVLATALDLMTTCVPSTLSERDTQHLSSLRRTSRRKRLVHGLLAAWTHRQPRLCTAALTMLHKSDNVEPADPATLGWLAQIEKQCAAQKN